MGPFFGRNCRGKRPPSTSAGWRVVGGRRIFFRSRWEYNYACYIEWLKWVKVPKKAGDIIEWQFESETFWFPGIKRGTTSYLPDFIVYEVEEVSSIGIICSLRKVVHEVKGYMDARSKTKLKRMAKYYPDTKVVVIDEAWFRKNAPKLQHIVPGWEAGNKKAY